MITLVSDTETTGLPPKGRSTIDQRPWIIQLAGIMYKEARPVGHMSCMVNPKQGELSGTIPNEKFWADNKLREEDISDCWFETELAFKIFHQYCRRADRIVFHNAKYDVPRIEDTFMRILGEVPQVWKDLPKFCTMLTLEPIMKLPSKWGKGYKWPNLDEAYRAYVDPNGFEDAHDAMADVNACAKVLFAIEEKDIPLVQI